MNKPVGKEVAVAIHERGRKENPEYLWIDVTNDAAGEWVKRVANEYGTLQETKEEDKRRFTLVLLRNYSANEVKAYLESYPNVEE